MACLYRPHIPLKVRCHVAERQLAAYPTIQCLHLVVDWDQTTDRARLESALTLLARAIGCEIKDLRLDHEPALALRPQERRGLGKKTYYLPDANDPEYLAYRPHGAQFDGSHDVKTRLRGDHGQFSDIALIKRQRRRERPAKPKRAISNASKFPKSPSRIKQKTKWPSRPFNRGKK